MMATGPVQLLREVPAQSNCCRAYKKIGMREKGRIHLVGRNLSSQSLRQDAWSFHVLSSSLGPISPISFRCKVFTCQSLLTAGGENGVPFLKSTVIVLTRSYNALYGSSLMQRLIPAIGIMAFAALGLEPLVRLSRNIFLQKSDNTWKKSSVHYALTSYVQPILLWTGAILICRAFDPVLLPSEASQAVKQRLLVFVRSLSTVLAFAYCLSSLIQQIQKLLMETNDSSDARNMGFQFAGKAIYTAVWVAAVSLFMELLGFSTQKWLTAGGLGTVLLTLAGREIFTNFLSSVMIHATRPFILNEWIQTKIDGYEVSGTVEHVGWWSPTIIRGDDREAIHIPNHKFTMNVVRNLSQKTHWRIKTHIAISHLDVKKINIIVADMRKVLAKNPQVEQQRLHRRVFLDIIDPENQALMILISCFVKTSHFEEYLCVKEAVLLDLLRVISHHRARLATPIRTMHKVYSDADVDIPFADTIFSRSREPSNRPFLLIEPSYKINSDDKPKGPARSIRKNEEKDAKLEETSSSDSQTNAKIGSTSTSNLDSKTDNQDVPEALKNKVSNSDDALKGGLTPEKTPVTSSEESGSQVENPVTVQQIKQPIGMSTLEENIVLGVALDGSKRTLPIEDGIETSPVESKELAACRNGSSSPPISQNPAAPSAAAQTDQRENER